MHGDPQVLGRKILLDRKPYVMIGVMPRSFEFPLLPGHVNASQLWAPMRQAVSDSEGARRFNTALISAFAIAAVLLAVLGIYSVIAFSVALRTQEMAMRLALGSRRADIVKLVLTSGAKLAAVGCGLGLLGAVAASQLLRSLLFGVSPFDPLVLTFVAVVILLLALAASAVPAMRAASVEPSQALRE
ncbi:MAG: FtsX-like permease family protein [Acidobacteriaceae bacterium]